MGRKEGSVGKILPKYHVEILREDGTFCPPGSRGRSSWWPTAAGIPRAS